jgi:HYR domain.
MNVGYFFLDITPPKVQCPENIVVGTDPDEDYATVNWTVPIATGKLGIEKKNCDLCCVVLTQYFILSLHLFDISTD